jgi:ketosteroid isomerase-like protein
MPIDPKTDELVALEEAFWHAAADLAFYREHMDADALMVFPAPFGVLNAGQVLEAVAQNTPWTRVEMRETKVTTAGDTAVVAYRAYAEKEDGSSYSTYAGSVYVRRDDAWKLVFHQQTPITDA